MYSFKNSINILHYCFYIMICKFNLISDVFNPLAYLHKIPFIKRRHEKLGVNFNKEINKAYNDKDFGISIMYAGGYLLGLIFILLMGLVLTVGNLFGVNLNLNYLYFGFFFIASHFICYFFIFRKDKYLQYFIKYESWTKQEKRIYILLSILFSVAVIFLFFTNLIFF